MTRGNEQTSFSERRKPMRGRTIAGRIGKLSAIMLCICMLFGIFDYGVPLRVKAAERTTCSTTMQVIKRLKKLEKVMNGKYFGNAVKKLVKNNKQLRKAVDEGLYDTDYYSVDDVRGYLGITDNGKYVNPFNNAGGCHAFALFIEYILFGQLSLKANTDYFVKYSGNELDNLILQAGDLLRESPWYDSNGKRYEHTAVVEETESASRDAKVSVVESNIASSKYGSNYIQFGKNGFRNSESYDTSKEITAYLKKHGGFVLRYRYIENDGCTDEPEGTDGPGSDWFWPTIFVDVENQPSWIQFKKCFNVTGNIKCDYPGDLLTAVHSYIRSEDGSRTYDETVEYPWSSSLNIKHAAVNLYSDFNKLSRGNYKFEIEAFSMYGGSVSWACYFTIY